MKYEYTYRNTTTDYWQFYMSNIYHQWTAVVNVVFTIAAFALIVSRWRGAHPLFKCLMVLLFLLFPVIQPLVILEASFRRFRAIKADTTLIIDDKGFAILVKDHRQLISWNDFKGMVSRRGQLVLFPDDTHAYILPDRVTGDEKDELERFIALKFKGKSR